MAAACGGGGSLVGAAAAGRVARHLSTGPTIVFGNALWAAGAVIAGALLAGVLGGAIGLRATLLLGAVGLAVGCLLLLLSPVREVRDI